jgi:hypothetical protein
VSETFNSVGLSNEAGNEIFNAHRGGRLRRRPKIDGFDRLGQQRERPGQDAAVLVEGRDLRPDAWFDVADFVVTCSVGDPSDWRAQTRAFVSDRRSGDRRTISGAEFAGDSNLRECLSRPEERTRTASGMIAGRDRAVVRSDAMCSPPCKRDARARASSIGITIRRTSASASLTLNANVRADVSPALVVVSSGREGGKRVCETWMARDTQMSHSFRDEWVRRETPTCRVNLIQRQM